MICTKVWCPNVSVLAISGVLVIILGDCLKGLFQKAWLKLGV